ncbi:Uncharacterised protein [Mycobacteroides abscessus subsp. abscessus]|uniref:Uncharacterized protein n=2 Tax=Mycobacteroides abscessus TaxID=36809 RepID=A0AB33TF28_9MYCO|nr:Uncharacterised protein [Mycobacteroides abscessus]SII43592.1 Uncharacterised protein [Mycobacteroides abscessus subsp. abscessus]CPT77190.1 Uncharacterised protein [Mycobacteroides abscessus]CPT78564.1 Uncharacterised protein [Mycobacteroides abscessus]CPV18332.1 Uncharacterised protein [Mycobacteroides abscessus]
MVMDEFVTAVLGFAVGCAATAALYVGLLGMVGATRVVRCTACSHWMVSWTDSAAICTRCRHPLLWHPVIAMRRRRGIKTEALTVTYGPVGAPVSRSDAGLTHVPASKG